DLPVVDGDTWTLEVGGRVERPLSLSLVDLHQRPQRTLLATMECAGNGRAGLAPRALSQPWLLEAVGTGAWTGTPLGPLLAEAGLHRDAVEVVFRGLDRGIEGGIEQEFGRRPSGVGPCRACGPGPCWCPPGSPTSCLAVAPSGWAPVASRAGPGRATPPSAPSTSAPTAGVRGPQPSSTPCPPRGGPGGAGIG